MGGPGEEGTAFGRPPNGRFVLAKPGIGICGRWAGGKGGDNTAGFIIEELPFGNKGGAFDRTQGGGLGRFVVVEVCDADMH